MQTGRKHWSRWRRRALSRPVGRQPTSSPTSLHRNDCGARFLVMRSIVEIRGLHKTYVSPRGSVNALAEIDLDIRQSEFLSVLGPSGCGKSTLLRCIAGLEDISSGTIKIRGNALAGPPEN